MSKNRLTLNDKGREKYDDRRYEDQNFNYAAKERGPLPYVQLQEKARLQQENDFAKAMAELKYEDKISVDDKQMVSLCLGISVRVYLLYQKGSRLSDPKKDSEISLSTAVI